MRNIALLLGFIAAATFGTLRSADAQTTLGPKLSYTTDVVDYGEVEYAGNGERSWTFRNDGKQPLMITHAKGSCGCTIPEYPKEPIMPGREGVIKIKYDTKRSGPIDRSVTITTNEPEGSNLHKIQVKGNVKAAAPADGVTPAQPAGGSVPAAH
ncbi:MAG: DUF1573 domain-containing protein [Flavobacteriales bacterium]